MSRARTGAALALLVMMMLALPGGSQSAPSGPTWAGTWDTDFGDMTLDAGGSGSYAGPPSGSISGTVDGRVDRGTWAQPGSPRKTGTFEFTMSSNGLSFSGVWEYDPPGSGCGTGCGWNGTCIAGACLKNPEAGSEPPPPRPCSDAGRRAFVSRCTTGSVPFGGRWLVPGPDESSATNVSPEPIRKATAQEVALALSEYIEEQERIEAELLVAFQLKLKTDRELGFTLKACEILARDREVPDFDEASIAEIRAAIDRARTACARLLSRELDTRTAMGGRAAANRCQASILPILPKGQKVTKRRFRRAVAAVKRKIATPCSVSRGKLTASIRAKGKGATLRATIGRRIRAAVARRPPEGNTAPLNERLVVRWRAKG